MKRKAIPAVAKWSASILLLCAAASVCWADINTDWQQCDQMLQSNDYSKAAGICNKIISEGSGTDSAVEAMFRLAQIYGDSGKPDLAINEYNQILANYPTSALRASLQIGYTYLIHGEYPQAIDALRFGIASAPAGTPKDDYDLKSMRCHLAECYVHSGDWDEAIASLKQFALDYPDGSASNRIDLADCYIAKGDHESAVTVLQNAIAALPVSTPKDDYNAKAMKCRLAQCYRELGDWDKAIACYQQLIIDYPDDAALSKQNLADCYLANNNVAAALNLLKTIKTDNLEVAADTLPRLADCYRKNTDWDNAVTVYLELMKQNPQDPARYGYELADCYSSKGAVESALSVYRQLAASSPKEKLRSWFYMGWCYQTEQKWSDAISAYRTAISNAPADSPKDEYYLLTSRLNIADCYQELGDTRRCKSDLKSIADGLPKDSIHSATCYFDSGDYQSAIDVCQKLADERPELTKDAFLLISDCLRSQGKSEETLDYLQKLAVEHPEMEADTLARQAEVYSENLNDDVHAIAELEQLKSKYPGSPQSLDAEAKIANMTLFGLHDIEGAKSMLQNIISQHPEYSSLVSVGSDLGYCSYMQGNYSEAAQLFSQALSYKEIGNYHAMLTYMAADCYHRLGNLPKAKELIDGLLNTYPFDCWAQAAKQKYALLTGKDEAK